MPGILLAAVSPDNTPHGYNWTFAFPMLLFIVIAAILYALFSRPHRRVPAGPIMGSSSRMRTAAAARGHAAATGTTPGGATAVGPAVGGRGEASGGDGEKAGGEGETSNGATGPDDTKAGEAGE